MKKIVVSMLAVCATMVSLAMSLEEARGRIGAVVADPDEMTSVMKQLSAADQKSFLAEVNAAIAKLPGSEESKVAKFLNVNKAALRGAAKGNLITLIAEVFATVPPVALTVLNESFASDLFNRAANPSVSYTDEQFTKIAEAIIDKVSERVKDMDDGARRTSFAICMMSRASNGSPADLVANMVKKLPEDAQNQALNKWIPAATGEKQTKNYGPLLGEDDGTPEISARSVMRFSGPQQLETMLGDVVHEVPWLTTTIYEIGGGMAPTPLRDQSLAPAPKLTDDDQKEPGGYQGQTF